MATVIGYHGCEKSVAKALIQSGSVMNPSSGKYEWLGHGVYFWEDDLSRAWEWARRKDLPKPIAEPAVVGAVIELGNCLDLMKSDHIALLNIGYESLKAFAEIENKTLPENRAGRLGMPQDKPLRELDCAVIQALCQQPVPDTPSFDTVRGAFIEGEEAYPGAKLYRLTHIQIAVRNEACIKGLFWPR